ncbi:hypothetical protein AA101099_2080 [Neoasaia chiangmaiensis NBRC 101099]|nr:hypothetical protein AA101099_2080 [Neoasaia chiangmaiensis NBRC 101099]GEN13932.1 hypothetical protein NCH01_03630 [Neoasaia chiangmaiensis]
MLCSESVPHQIVKELEDTLRKEFISNFSQRARTSAYKRMADIFNIMENRSGEKILLSLSKTSPEETECIKGLMFTFEDLSRLRPEALTRILAQLDKDILPIALKGATKEQKNVFYRIMSDRAIRLLQDNMEALGSVRLRDVEKAKAEIVFLAKEMNENGEIELDPEENEMVIE